MFPSICPVKRVDRDRDARRPRDAGGELAAAGNSSDILPAAIAGALHTKFVAIGTGWDDSRSLGVQMLLRLFGFVVDSANETTCSEKSFAASPVTSRYCEDPVRQFGALVRQARKRISPVHVLLEAPPNFTLVNSNGIATMGISLLAEEVRRGDTTVDCS